MQGKTADDGFERISIDLDNENDLGNEADDENLDTFTGYNHLDNLIGN